jgi:hypothetical protein
VILGKENSLCFCQIEWKTCLNITVNVKNTIE